MSDENIKKKVNDWANNQFPKMPSEYVDQMSRQEIERAKNDFQVFKEKFERGQCPTCSESINSLIELKPCDHWLLNPPGFKKKHFELIMPLINEIGLFRLQAFLRWVANIEDAGRGISEKGENTVEEVTIRYTNLEWSFSAKESDYEGHQGSQNERPQYHFQMKIDGNIFVKFNDYHLELTDEDIFKLEMIRNHSDKFKHSWLYGASTSDLLEENLDAVLENTVTADKYEEGAINIQSMVMADEGTTISGDDIADLIEESKRIGKPFATLLHKLKNAKSTVVVSPGPGVVEKANRAKRRKK